MTLWESICILIPDYLYQTTFFLLGFGVLDLWTKLTKCMHFNSFRQEGLLRTGSIYKVHKNTLFPATPVFNNKAFTVTIIIKNKNDITYASTQKIRFGRAFHYKRI